MSRHLAEPIFFTPPPTKIDRRMWKGGGSGSPYYAELEKLYGEQAAMARTMRGVAEGTVIPAYQGLMQDANEFDSIANRERAAQVAGADMRGASSANIKMQADELASLGVNPADFNDDLKGLAVQGAGMEAGAMTGARDRMEQMGWARRKDITGMGMGLPGQASEMIGSAGAGFGNLASMKNQDDQNTSNNIASTVQGGMNAYRIWRGADGGYVEKKKLGIGPDGAKGYFTGGPVRGGFMSPQRPTSPPPVAPRPQGPGAGDTLSVGADSAKTMYDANQGKPLSAGIGKDVSWMGDKLGSAGMQEFGQGMQLGQAGLRDLATQRATAAVDQAMGNEIANIGTQYGSMGTDVAQQVALENMAVSGEIGLEAANAGVQAAQAGSQGAGLVAGATDAALIGGAGELATAGTVAAEAGTAAMGGLGAAGAAIGTAVPVIGAGLAVASLLGAFGKDGGQVHGGRGIQPRIDPTPDGQPGYAKGGPVYPMSEQDMAQAYEAQRQMMELAKQAGPTERMPVQQSAGEYVARERVPVRDLASQRGLSLPPREQFYTDPQAGYAAGGTVQGRAPGFDGGDVEGPGGPEDDLVPAWLSDGEFVLNADAVKHFGLDRLQKMNQVGLDKRRGISKEKNA